MEIPESWAPFLGTEARQPYFQNLEAFVAQERSIHEVYPPEEDVFNALRFTSLERTSVLLLGQDPYHDQGQAHGLCFSVRPGIAAPPSLRNIFQELKSDLGCRTPNNGCLTPWADQGVLLLNAVLTVRAHQANSHRGRGWETFTDAVLRRLNERPTPVVFVLWGGYARKKAELIDARRHTVVESAHPSPLSAHNGFFGSRSFSKINAALTAAGRPPIEWQIPDL